jgi:hypothetical protein
MKKQRKIVVENITVKNTGTGKVEIVVDGKVFPLSRGESMSVPKDTTIPKGLGLIVK